ncbi:hypothetical protein [Candidatus Liberibacter brunswickensis]|uniref:hypothetical protein n=1 Tax=Candidatus Liberibacter brunswickensis TaxID=1968796 RepID=UPI002FDFAAAF
MEEYFRVFYNLIGNSLIFLNEANKQLDQGYYKYARFLILKGMQFKRRASLYSEAFIHHYCNYEYIKDHPLEGAILTDKINNIDSIDSEYTTLLDKVRSRVCSLNPLVLKDRLKSIEQNLEDSNILCDQISKEIGEYLKYLERKPAVKSSSILSLR